VRGKIAKALRRAAQYDMRIERRQGQRPYRIKNSDMGRKTPAFNTSGARFDYQRMKDQYKALMREMGHRIFGLKMARL